MTVDLTVEQSVLLQQAADFARVRVEEFVKRSYNGERHATSDALTEVFEILRKAKQQGDDR